MIHLLAVCRIFVSLAFQVILKGKKKKIRTIQSLWVKRLVRRLADILFSEEHSIFAVWEASVELLTLLQQGFLLGLVETVDLEVVVSVEGPPFHRLLGVLLGFHLYLLGVYAQERLASLGLLTRRSSGSMIEKFYNEMWTLQGFLTKINKRGVPIILKLEIYNRLSVT